jgi:hypothetical protein
MKRKSVPVLAVLVLVAALALGALLGSLGGAAQLASAAPLAAPTPITVSAGDEATAPATFWRAKALTASGASNVYELPAADRLDLQWVVDETVVNTTTLKLQFSNDGTNWVDGLDVEANIAADKNDLQQFNTFGRFVRLYATLTNSNPVTVTAIGVAK